MKPDIHVFRSAPQFNRNADGEVIENDPDGMSDSINVRIIDTNIYAAIRLSIVDARTLIRDIQSALDTRNN